MSAKIIQNWRIWGATQRAIAKALGVSVRTVQDWCQGRRAVPAWVNHQLPPDIPIIHSEWMDWDDRYPNGCISYPATISWRRAECHYGQPVIVILDKAYGPAEMPAGEIQVPPDLVDELRRIGYLCQPMPPAERRAYWRKASKPKSLQSHWHPAARVIYY